MGGRLIPYAGYDPRDGKRGRIPIDAQLARDIKAEGKSWPAVAEKLTKIKNRAIPFRGPAVRIAVLRFEKAL